MSKTNIFDDGGLPSGLGGSDFMRISKLLIKLSISNSSSDQCFGSCLIYLNKLI